MRRSAATPVGAQTSEAVAPPSTTYAVPDAKRERSEARNSASPAISSGSPSRPWMCSMYGVEVDPEHAPRAPPCGRITMSVLTQPGADRVDADARAGAARARPSWSATRRRPWRRRSAPVAGRAAERLDRGDVDDRAAAGGGHRERRRASCTGRRRRGRRRARPATPRGVICTSGLTVATPAQATITSSRPCALDGALARAARPAPRRGRRRRRLGVGSRTPLGARLVDVGAARPSRRPRVAGSAMACPMPLRGAGDDRDLAVEKAGS